MINPIVCRNNNLLINKYKSLEELNISVANNLYESILESKLNFSLAICGGKTPIGIFSLLSQHFLKKIPWEKVEVYWLDERYVPQTSMQSNFGNAYSILFNKTPGIKLNRIKTENPIEKACHNYNKILKRKN